MNIDPFAHPWLINSIYVLLSCALLVALARLLKGPSLPDREVDLDLIATIILGFVALNALESGRAIFLDVAIVIGLIAFLGTAAIARYLEKGARI